MLVFARVCVQNSIQFKILRKVRIPRGRSLASCIPRLVEIVLLNTHVSILKTFIVVQVNSHALIVVQSIFH